MTDYNPELEKAHVGADFEEFCRGKVGSYLLERADRDEVAALRKLAEVNPDDKEAIHRLQLEARTPRRAVEWIKKTIEEGRAAHYIIEQERETY